ncbi:MAG: threonylcarbamoyl-AMP synthase [Eubacterium sp.]|nr:threonylcarbamoyl-AMP synthase [Eubacterium sp.]
MVTRVIKADADSSLDFDKRIKEAAVVIKEGGLVAFPTETVYGLGADALQPEAARKIYEAKGRPSDNPLIIHVASLDFIEKIAKNVPAEAKKMAAKFWPGPLTMIFEKTDCVPFETTGGMDTVAVRMPDHAVALALIRESGGYIAAPSANTSGRPSPTTAAHVAEDMDGRIPLILDGGAVGIGLESTIIDFTAEEPTILRPGYITLEMAKEVLGTVRMDAGLISADSSRKPKAPGMKYRHYAPKAELTIVEGTKQAVVRMINQKAAELSAQGKRAGIICTDETRENYPKGDVISVGSRKKEETIAKNLFAVLREFDHRHVDAIYAESFETNGIGQAIMNRLQKAAGHRKIEANTGDTL